MTMGFTLGPSGDEETLDESLESDEKDSGSTEPTEIEQLKAELAAARSLNAQQIDDLKRSVGRVQSVAAKAGTVSRDDLAKELNKGFGSVNELLLAIVEQADPTVFPDALKAQMKQAADVARRQTERDSLKEEILKELPQPQEPVEAASNVMAEQRVNAELASAGLAGADLDWTAADKEWLAGGVDALLANVRAQIAAIKDDEDVAPKRQARKTAATRTPSGGPAGGGKTDADVFLDPKAPFEQRLAVFRKLVG